MKIKVFVRHCKFSSNSAHKNNRPHYFTREGCFNNLLNTIDKDCDVTVSFDGNLTESDHFLNKDIYKGKFIKINRIITKLIIESKRSYFKFIK
jgi:hypothetical protein